MIHNSLEYVDMELIAEAYDLLKRGLNLSNFEIGEIFHKWNDGYLKSYLIEITSKIFRKKEKDSFIIDYILDIADQKGTGLWAAIDSLKVNIKSLHLP